MYQHISQKRQKDFGQVRPKRTTSLNFLLTIDHIQLLIYFLSIYFKSRGQLIINLEACQLSKDIERCGHKPIIWIRIVLVNAGSVCEGKPEA